MGMAAQKLAAYAAAAGPDVALYVVTPTEAGDEIRVFRWQGDPHDPFPEAPVPDFALLANKALLNAVKENRDDRKSTTKALWITSWLLAALVGALLALKKLGRLDLDSGDLAALGAFVGLVILPFAGKLKILGFEYEALRSETRK